MRICFWGVRGSYPVPGPSTVRYGGHTSCVEARTRADECLIVDAGTGLRALGHRLAEQQGSEPAHYHIALSHVHWDHIQGLPYFEPAYLEGTRISIYAMRTAKDELQQVIGGITRHEFFPVNLEAVPADFEFLEIVPGRAVAAGAFELQPFALNHPFGAVGYRVLADDTSFAYVSDTAPFTDMLHKQHFLAGPETPSAQDLDQLGVLEAALRDTLRGTDTVIYDTHFLPEEYRAFPHYGHSTPDHALEICRGLGVRRLVLFHHAPGHSDEMMDRIAVTYSARGRAVGIEVVVAKEGMVLSVGEGDEP
jgi:phosphoribosyl 1,2-cyclic phosphodiesterase